MGNPEYLLFDADVLIQIFRTSLRTKQRGFFAGLRDRFGVQPAVVPEVESEVRWNGRFRSQFEKDMERLRSDGYVQILEKSVIKRLLQDRGQTPIQVEETLKAHAARGRKYNAHVDLGEAYTHAAAVELCLPAATNDWKAIVGLTKLSLPTAAPALRFFDCLCLLREEGILSSPDCDVARDELRTLKEYVPKVFDSHQPFDDCAIKFDPRLRPAVASVTHAPPAKYNDILYLQPL